MVTQDMNENSIQTIYLTSDETKPSGLANGSVVIEVDTAARYRYDAENDIWYPAGYVEVIL